MGNDSVIGRPSDRGSTRHPSPLGRGLGYLATDVVDPVAAIGFECGPTGTMHGNCDGVGSHHENTTMRLVRRDDPVNRGVTA